MNAIIGDNGIITRAQEATVLQNCANLEEYLNQEYIVGVADEKLENGDSEIKLTPLEQMIRLHSDYFFKNGSYDYIIFEYTSEEGKTEYLKIRLINKEKLGEDVKNQLSIGDAKGNSREAYLEFEDVFGVTDDLKVFYCKKGILSAIGADFLKSGILDSTKVMQKKNSPASKALAESTATESRDLTVADLWSTRELTVSNTSGATDLSFLVDMPNIERLTLKNYAGNLSGIKCLVNLKYLLIDNHDNVTNIDYDGLRECIKLAEIDFYMPTDIELEKMCTEMSYSDYENLKTLKLSGFISGLHGGVEAYITGLSWGGQIVKDCSNLTSIKKLSLLTDKTSKSIDTLYINNNKITSLDGLQSFTNVTNLYARNNRIVVNDVEDLNSSLEIGNYISNMRKLTKFYCDFCNITDESLEKLEKNSSLVELSITGNSLLRSLDVIKLLPNLTRLEARENKNFNISDDELLKKLSRLSVLYMDDCYATRLALVDIGQEVYLGQDAEDDDVEFLLSEDVDTLNKIECFEILNNKNISDAKLQELLKKLTNMTVLQADNSNLASFDFIKESNTKLEWVSVLGTSISNLSGLERCSELKGLRINTDGLNLRQYSKMISNMCKKKTNTYLHLKCGDVTIGGLSTTVPILNTLNGKVNDINSEFTCFGDYSSGIPKDPGGMVDFSFTGLTTTEGSLWHTGMTIKLPSCFESYNAKECAGVTVDYSLLNKASTFDCNSVNSSNFEYFKGYETVRTSYVDPTSVIGTNTKNLILGKCNIAMNGTALVKYPIQSIVDKVENLETLEILGALSLNLSDLSKLSIKSLEIQYSSIYGLGLENTTSNNMGDTLNTLTIANCSSFNNLNGLDKFSNIKTLNLTNDSGLGDVQAVTKEDGSKENKNTCEYIVESLPYLQTITLSGSGIKNYNYLKSHGFRETETGSGIFTKIN